MFVTISARTHARPPRRLLAAAWCVALAVACTRPAPPAAPPVEATDDDNLELVTPLPKRAFRFGRAPTLSPEITRKNFQPVVEYIAKAVGHPLTLEIPSSYDATIEKVLAGKLDFAFLSPFAYVNAKKRMPELRLLASMLGEGSATYRGYIVTSIDSPVTEVAALKGKRFAFVDRHSTSGYLLAVDMLRQAGLDPERDFKKSVFGGSHPAVVELILSGKADAGAIASTTFNHMKTEGIAQKLVILAKSEWMPFDAVVAHPSVPVDFADRVKRAFLELSVRTAEGRAVLLNTTSINGFVDGDDATYDPVRAVSQRLGVE